MADNTDPTEDMIRAEIAKAVEILRSDGIHIHKTYAQFQKTLTPDKPNDKQDKQDTTGQPPPAKDTPDPDPIIRKGLWWGTRQ